MKDTGIAEGVTIVNLGLGKVVSNWGTYLGKPCVFLEPVLGEAGSIAENVPDNQEPQITKTTVSAGGVILVIHDPRGAKVVMEDLQSAIATTEAQ